MGEYMSNLSGSSSSSSSSATSVSSVTSVPTTVHSLGSEMNVSSSQRERWTTQLSQLAELGFGNEAECVNALEKLSAANIGVGLYEEVTVTQVVNELCKM